MKEFSYKEIEAATKGFAIEQLIGKGSHGRVYKGVLKCGQLVAVKKPSEGPQVVQNHAKLNHEIGILASVKNPGIVNLIGVSNCATNKLLVMEFMQNGSLHDLLHLSPKPPAWHRRATMALQIARAILALHVAAPAIIHRDIKSANILLDSKWNARLADFSLAVRDNSLQPVALAIPAGTIGYLDPCYTESGMLCPQNDVFSFGVVLLELISSRKVLDMDSDPSSIVSWAVPLIRANQISEVCDKRVASPDYLLMPICRMLNVALRCVSEKVERRPVMEEIVGELQGAMENMFWPIWSTIRNKVKERVCRCVDAWKRGAQRRVTTTRIVCKDHLVDGENEDCAAADKNLELA